MGIKNSTRLIANKAFTAMNNRYQLVSPHMVIATLIAVVSLAVALNACSAASDLEQGSQSSVASAGADSVRLYFCSEATRRSCAANAEKFGIRDIDASGNGDCILLVFDDADGPHFALIDTGAEWDDGDGSTVAVEWLRSHGVERLDWLLITHQHNDHMGDAVRILEEFEVGALYMKHFDGQWVLSFVTDERKAREVTGVDDGIRLEAVDGKYVDAGGVGIATTSSSKGYADLLQAALSNGTRVVGPSWAEVNPDNPVCAIASPKLAELKSWRVWLKNNATAGTPSMIEAFDESNTRLTFGPAEVKLVNWREHDKNGNLWWEGSDVPHEVVVGENQNSLGVLLSVGGTRAFLAGDIECRDIWLKRRTFSGNLNDEQRIAGDIGDIDFLKVGHHGYDTSTSEELLSTMLPEAAMITNMSGRASASVVKRLGACGCAYMYTTEDPVEAVVELTPDAVRMGRASAGDWYYETPYHEIIVRDGVDGLVMATLVVRDGRTVEWPEGLDVPEHDSWRCVGLPDLPQRVRESCEVVVEYEWVARE